MVEAAGDHTAIVVLFERCLVACASYPGAAYAGLMRAPEQGAWAQGGGPGALER